MVTSVADRLRAVNTQRAFDRLRFVSLSSIHSVYCPFRCRVYLALKGKVLNEDYASLEQVEQAFRVAAKPNHKEACA